MGRGGEGRGGEIYFGFFLSAWLSGRRFAAFSKVASVSLYIKINSR